LIFDFNNHIFAKNFHLKKVRITPDLVKKIIEQEEILTFSYFIKLKYLYTNSTIYNFSIRKAGGLIKVSVGSIKHHLDLMNEMGIIKITKNKNGGKNITFSSIEKISKIYGVKHNSKCGSIYFHNSESIQDIKTRLYSKILKTNINKQKYTIKGKSNSLMRKRDQLKKMSNNDFMKIRLERSIASERINFDSFLCCQTIGEMFNKTKMTGYNQLKKMSRMGLFKIEKKYMTVLNDCTRNDYQNLYKYGQMQKGKYFYSQKDCSILKNVGFKIEVL
jgi:DNA-binding MarR family transcriptional regulator